LIKVYITTTWNTLCSVVRDLPGNWDGLELVEEDFPVALRPLQDFPGWLEVEVPSDRDEYGFDTCYVLPDGRATCLSDWIPELRDRIPELEENALYDREGIAVPADILRELDIPPCDHPCVNGFNHRRAPVSLTVDEIRYIVQPTDTFRASVGPDWWIEWEDGPHRGAICILCGAQSGTHNGVPDCEDAEIRSILMRMVAEGEDEDDLKEHVFVRIKNNFRDVLFHCPVCGWHLQTEAGAWNIGCQHYEIRYPGGLVGYHPPEGTEWEEAGLFEELASPLNREE
jgi:hypothetical protein